MNIEIGDIVRFKTIQEGATDSWISSHFKITKITDKFVEGVTVKGCTWRRIGEYTVCDIKDIDQLVLVNPKTNYKKRQGFIWTSR